MPFARVSIMTRTSAQESGTGGTQKMNRNITGEHVNAAATKTRMTTMNGTKLRWKVMDVAWADNIRNPRCLVVEVNPKYPGHCYTTCSQSDGIGSHSDHSLRTQEEWLKWLERFSDDLTGRELREAREAALAPFVEPPSWAGFRERYKLTGDPWLPEGHNGRDQRPGANT